MVCMPSVPREDVSVEGKWDLLLTALWQVPFTMRLIDSAANFRQLPNTLRDSTGDMQARRSVLAHGGGREEGFVTCRLSSRGSVSKPRLMDSVAKCGCGRSLENQ